MLKTRVMPCLLLKGRSLIKTVQFNKFTYVGDPVNTVRIYNELEVDELIFLDIYASQEKREPNYEVLIDIADECFMPMTYGGGIKAISQMRKIFEIGFEKIAINTSSYSTPELLTEAAKVFGSQSVVASMDVKRNLFGKYQLYSNGQMIKQDPVERAIELEKLGAGELLITSVDQEGTWKGYDVDLLKAISSKVNIPVIANGGARNLNDLHDAVKIGQADACAAGSLFVFQKEGMGVLVNYPKHEDLEKVLP